MNNSINQEAIKAAAKQFLRQEPQYLEKVSDTNCSLGFKLENKYFLKFFKRRVLLYDRRSIYNHYTSAGDGHPLRYKMLKEASHFFPDLFIRPLDIGRGYVIFEYFEGETLENFLKTNTNLAQAVSSEFGKKVKQLHDYDYAHGDPHLGNVLIKRTDEGFELRFIDLCMLHHPKFSWCQEFKCFQHYNRYKEDLSNSCGKLGSGYLTHLHKIEQETNNLTLVGSFLESYGSKTNN